MSQQSCAFSKEKCRVLHLGWDHSVCQHGLGADLLGKQLPGEGPGAPHSAQEPAACLCGEEKPPASWAVPGSVTRRSREVVMLPLCSALVRDTSSPGIPGARDMDMLE